MEYKIIVLALIVLLSAKAVQAVSVREVSNVCTYESNGYEKCSTILELDDLTVSDLNVIKSNFSLDSFNKKVAFRSGIPVTNTIDFNTFTWKDRQLTVTGIIRIGTDNYWGIDKIYNSSWWNSSWTYRMNFTIANGLGYQRVNEEIVHNFTNLTNSLPSKWDIKIFNASCVANNGTEHPYKIISNGTIWVELMFRYNLSAGATNTWCMYWANPSATEPIYNTNNWIYDNFTGATLNYSIWNWTGTTDASYKNGTVGGWWWVNESDAGGTPSFGALHSQRIFQENDTFCYDIRFNLTYVGPTFTYWSFLNFGFINSSTTTRTHGLGAVYNTRVVYARVGDASDNINGNSGGQNTTWQIQPTNNRLQIFHIAPSVNYARFSDDGGAMFTWRDWTLLNQVNSTPYRLSLGKRASSGGYGDASPYSYYIDSYVATYSGVCNVTIEQDRYGEEYTTTTTTTVWPETLGNRTEFCCIPYEAYCMDNDTMAQKYNINNITTYAYVACQYGCDPASNSCFPSPFNQNIWALLIITGLIIAIIWWLRGS